MPLPYQPLLPTNWDDTIKPAAYPETLRSPGLVNTHPRIWTALVVGVLAVVAELTVASVALFSLALAKGPEEVLSKSAVMIEWIQDFGASPDGFLYLVLPSQLVLLFAGAGAASFSPEPFYRRLGLVRSSLPLWTLPILALGTPFVGMTVHELFPDLAKTPGTQLYIFDQIIRSQTGFVALFALICVSLLPGFVEEILFRGYVQRRLLTRWNPLAAVAVSTALFAVAHIDPRHMLAILPLGIWLGVIAWRTGSVWPGIMCHMVNNFVAFCLIRFTAPSIASIDMEEINSAMLYISGAAFLLSGFFLIRYGREPFRGEAYEDLNTDFVYDLGARVR